MAAASGLPNIREGSIFGIMAKVWKIIAWNERMGV
jgi:hypothetical protein